MKIDIETYGPGRPLLPETKVKMEAMLKEIQKEPGIRSAKLARLVGLKSQECANLARKLEKRGLLTTENRDGARHYKIVQ